MRTSNNNNRNPEREGVGHPVEVEDGTRGAVTLEGRTVRHRIGAATDFVLRRHIGKPTLGVGSNQGGILEGGHTGCRRREYMKCTNKMSGNWPVVEE